MIPVSLIEGNQFTKARGLLNLPVVATAACTFRVPSSSRGERDHKVQLDDPQHPGACSCTCEAGLMSQACWAMARVLLALAHLRAGNVHVFRGAESAQAGLEAAAGALEPLGPSTFHEDGDVGVLWRGQPPEAELLFSITD